MNFVKSHGSSIGYFGKLPNFPDFIKFNAGSDEILILDKWIQEGIVLAKSLFKNKWKEYYRNSDSYMFIYPFTSNTIIGIIKPCTDKSGREFPFLMFIKLESVTTYIPYYLIPFCFYNILYSIIESLKDIDSNPIKPPFDLASMNEMLNKVSSRLSSLNRTEDYDKFKTNTSIKEFWERTTGDNSSSKKYNFAKNLIGLKTNAFISTIYLNFSSSKNFYKEDLNFFIQLILNSLHQSHFPAMFWSIKDNLIRLFLFSQKLIPINFVDLIYFKENEERVIDLFTEKTGNSFPLSNKTLFDKQNISLDEFLKEYRLN